MRCARCFGAGVLLALPAMGFGQAPRWLPATPSVDILCWQETRGLTHADFQADTKPAFAADPLLPEFTIDANTEASARLYDVPGETGRREGVVVRVEFYKDQSWMGDKLFYGPIRTLAHEQLHFDVVELTGRRLRWALARCAAAHQPLDGPKITAEIACIYEEEEALQSLYDEETLFDNKGVAQRQWAGRVHRSLQQLARYKSTERDCQLRLAD